MNSTGWKGRTFMKEDHGYYDEPDGKAPREAIQKAKQVLLPVIRGLFLFFSFAFLQCICKFDPLQVYDVIDGKNNFYLWFILFEYLFSFLLVYSSERLFTIRDRAFIEAYLLPETPKRRFFDRVRFAVANKPFLIEAAVCAFFFLVTPYGFHFSLADRAGEMVSGSILACPVALRAAIGVALFFGALLWGRLTGMKYRLKMTDKKELESIYTKRYLFLHLFLILALYCFFEATLFDLVVYSIVSILFSVAGIVWAVAKYVILAVIPVYLFLVLRSLRKRRKFIVQFKALCAEKGIECPKFICPYRSAIRLNYGENFRFTLAGETYSCKFLKGTRKWVPIIFEANGVAGYVHAIRFRNYTFFQFTTHFKYDYPADANKILILSPVPSQTLCVEQGKAKPIDNGEKLWDYTVYSATSFLNSFERETLTYVPKKYDRFSKWE